ncbi:hypothetical protein [Burkholderia sp. MSMB1835]|uniref:hypothetical protein n=1 Tax=Burkholderia sp. MSMB1835 TaxID=1637876 RepID=UPI000A991F90|nr:hypothetical protein [Burkholderia sp. MSMB1835]
MDAMRRDAQSQYSCIPKSALAFIPLKWAQTRAGRAFRDNPVWMNHCHGNEFGESILKIVHLFRMREKYMHERLKIFVKAAAECNHVRERPV